MNFLITGAAGFLGSHLANQLAREVERIAQMSEKNGLSANQSSQAATHLEAMASALKTSVDHFKV